MWKIFLISVIIMKCQYGKTVYRLDANFNQKSLRFTHKSWYVLWPILIVKNLLQISGTTYKCLTRIHWISYRISTFYRNKCLKIFCRISHFMTESLWLWRVHHVIVKWNPLKIITMFYCTNVRLVPWNYITFTTSSSMPRGSHHLYVC